MKFFDTVLGFAVLSGPLWLILILLPVCIWLAVKIAKRFKPGVARIAGGVGIFLLLFALPFGDEIAGRVYFNYLCATEAGVKVYQTVELPAEYWDERGRAKFYVNFDSLLGKTYSVKYKPGTYSSFFHIDNAGYAYSNTLTGQVLGEAIDFGYWGGWMRRNLSPHNTATGCINYAEPSNRLIDRIFIPEHSKSK
jgi:hypothetical protein